MKNNLKNTPSLRGFLILLGTQSFSSLGSAMTSFALIVWSYTQRGSALDTALLSVCSYAPYVLVSILAGALSDRWDKKRTLLVPREGDQQTSALRSMANSLVNILTTVLASAVLAFGGLRAVILFDLTTFAAAFVSLLCFVHIPDMPKKARQEGMMAAARWLIGCLSR